MPAINGVMMFMWQAYDAGTAAGTAHDVHLMMIFDGIIAFILLFVFLTFVAAGIFAMSLAKKVEAKIEKLEAQAHGIIANVTAKATPIIDKTNDLIADLSPKVKSIATEVEAISKTVRAKVDEVGETVSQVNSTVADINGKTRHQADRVDGIVTGALNTTHEVSKKVQQGIRYPIDQLSGIIAGVKAGLETLAQKSPFGKSKNVPNPYDL